MSTTSSSANSSSSELDPSELKLMEELTSQNRLMRRKLKTPDNQKRSRRVAVRLFVKDTEEIPQMRKKMKELEKMQEMYKQRIDELETQVSNFSSFHSSQEHGIYHKDTLSPPHKDSSSMTRSDSDSSGCVSIGSGSSSGMSISVEEPIATSAPTGSGQDNQYYRMSLRAHPDRTKLLALYDYAPQDDSKGRLAFKEGDVLLLVNMKSRSGWWLAELHGEIGKIPSNYVEQLDPTRAFKVRVIKNFDAQQPGDMSIQRGNTITVLKRQDNGWYLGEYRSKTGFFPSTSVERIVAPIS